MAYRSPDGYQRNADAERQLNEAFALTFNEKPGELVLQYLRSITIENVGGPHIEANHLVHLEGQRFIVALIEQRIRHGRNKQPSEENRHGRQPRTRLRPDGEAS